MPRAPAPACLAVAAGVLVAACGEVGDGSNAASINQIERLSTPQPAEKGDPEASARLQPLEPGDAEQQGLTGAGCRFERDGHDLLLAVGSDAIVRIGGEMRHLVHSAPVGPTGGFFEDRQLSVSVGRTHEAPAANAGGGRPARITVTNRRTGVQQEFGGNWNCGPATAGE